MHSMSAVGWAIVLALPAYAVLQLWAVMLLGRHFELDTHRPPLDDWGFTAQTVRTAPGMCRTCGTDNDPSYMFCSQCVNRLHTQ